jgi:hypothetical protein
MNDAEVQQLSVSDNAQTLAASSEMFHDTHGLVLPGLTRD